MRITKIRKLYRNSFDKQKGIPESVEIYQVDSETKKRDGYSTMYREVPGKRVYGVLYQKFYVDGKLHGQQFIYSMFYPQCVPAGQFYNLASVHWYTHNKKDGCCMDYDLKTGLPKSMSWYNNGEWVYTHSFTDQVDKFQVDFKSERQKRKGVHSLIFSSSEDIKYIVSDSFLSATGRFIGKFITRTVVSATVKVIKDLMYNQYGVKVSGFNIKETVRNEYTIHNSPFTAYVKQHLGLPQSAYVVKTDTYTHDGKLINSKMKLYRGSLVAANRLGLEIDTQNNYVFHVVGRQVQRAVPTGKVRKAGRSFVNMSPNKQKLLYLYLLATAC